MAEEPNEKGESKEKAEGCKSTLDYFLDNSISLANVKVELASYIKKYSVNNETGLIEFISEQEDQNTGPCEDVDKTDIDKIRALLLMEGELIKESMLESPSDMPNIGRVCT
jgi:hypothetical protein